MRARAIIATCVPVVLMLAACGGDDDGGDAGGADVDPVVAGEAFPDDRCEANKAAGPITYLSGFDFAAAASIMEVMMAADRGYYVLHPMRWKRILNGKCSRCARRFVPACISRELRMSPWQP